MWVSSAVKCLKTFSLTQRTQGNAEEKPKIWGKPKESLIITNLRPSTFLPLQGGGQAGDGGIAGCLTPSPPRPSP